tara:strand:- start:76775 stop:77134 length:360 start_codon:yes stop_codon:yes gene_type:complete
MECITGLSPYLETDTGLLVIGQAIKSFEFFPNHFKPLREANMSKVRFVPPEHADILREYLCDSRSVVLVMPNAKPAIEMLGVDDGDDSDYVSDDADVWVDIVEHENHAFSLSLIEDNKI